MSQTRFRLGIIFLISILILSISPSSAEVSSNPTELSPDFTINSHPNTDSYVMQISFVADYFFYQLWGQDTENQIQSIFDELNQIYLNSNVSIAFKLDQVIIFTDETTNNATFNYVVSGGEEDPNSLLTEFKDYALNEPMFDTSDNVLLLTGVDFTGFTYGLAYVGSVNWPYSVNQVTGNLNFNSLLVAHELGHNYDASHDGGNGCASTGYIMSSSIDLSTNDFSSCSILEIETFMSNNYNPSRVDDTVPILQTHEDIFVSKKSGDSTKITWDISDDNLGYFDIYVNDVLVVDDKYINDTTIEFFFDISTVGNYNVTLVAMDLAKHIVTDSINVEIVGDINPSISTNGDASVQEFTGILLNWTVIDDGEFVELYLFLDNSIIETNNITDPSLQSGYLYQFNFIPEIVRTYNFTLLVSDSSNQNQTSTIFLQVTDGPDIITSISNSIDTVSSDATITSVVVSTADPITITEENPFDLSSLPFLGWLFGTFTLITIANVVRRKN